MPWTTPKPGRTTDRSSMLRSVAAVALALLAGVGALVAQQFIFEPVFRAVVCCAPFSNSGTRITIGIIIASAVAVAAFGAARIRSHIVVLTVLLALETVLAAAAVFFLGHLGIPGAAELLVACGRESWQSYLSLALMIYPVVQGGAGIAASRLNAPWPIRLLMMCIASAVVSVLFAIAFAATQSAVG